MTAASIPFCFIIFTISHPFSHVINKHPIESNIYGLILNNSHISIISCFTEICLKSISRPVPEYSAISHSAANMPPSDASCIAPSIFCFINICASLAIMSSSSAANALLITSSGKTLSISSLLCDITVLIPLIPICFVITISCPATAF